MESLDKIDLETKLNYLFGLRYKLTARSKHSDCVDEELWQVQETITALEQATAMYQTMYVLGQQCLYSNLALVKLFQKERKVSYSRAVVTPGELARQITVLEDPCPTRDAIVREFELMQLNNQHSFNQYRLCLKGSRPTMVDDFLRAVTENQ